MSVESFPEDVAMSEREVFVLDAIPVGVHPIQIREAMVGLPIPVLGRWTCENHVPVDFKLPDTPKSRDVVTVLTDDITETLKQHHHPAAAHMLRSYHVGRCAVDIDRNLGHFEKIAS